MGNNNSDIIMCQFCKAAPARAGDVFCCDACKTLADLQSFPQNLPGGEGATVSEQDRLITQHYGQIRSSNAGKKNSNKLNQSNSEDSNLLPTEVTLDAQIPLTGELTFNCSVERLACEACVQQLSELKNYIPGIVDLRWDRRSSTLNFTLPQEGATPTYVYNLLKKMGLKPRWLTPDEVIKDTSHTRTLLTRLAITGALFGNIMLYTIPIYAGLAGTYAQLFIWIQALLFLPVFFWSAKPFYVTSIANIKIRQLSTDLPLTLAFLIGSAISFYGLMSGHTQWIYFDSLSGFLFLILLSRYLLERSLINTQSKHQLDTYLENAFYETVMPDKSLQLQHWKSLKKGDHIYVKNEQRLPADGHLISESCELDTSWVTGEFWPQLFLKNSFISSGSLVVGPSCLYQIDTLPQDSSFIKLLKSLNQGGEKLNSSFESKVGVGLVLVSFFAVLFLFLFFSSLGLEELIKRSLALWIVACPCAISFAAPLTRAIASLSAEKLGFWIRDPDAFKLLHKVKAIAFDKTGTITESLLALKLDIPLLDPWLKQIVLSLENISHHPIAGALRRTLGTQELLNIQNPQEIVGQGVQGYFNGDFYELKKSNDQIRSSIELRKNNQVLFQFDFEEQIYPHLKAVIESLKQNYLIYILSGDHIERVQKISRALGLENQNIFAGLTPEDKKNKILELKPDLYLGDGTNDLLALKAVPLSISFGNASLEAQQASQIIMTHADFSKLPKLFRLSLESHKLLKRNFGIALTYNLGAGLASLLGFIGPLEAAVLMPLASLTLLVSTSIKTKWIRAQKG